MAIYILVFPFIKRLVKYMKRKKNANQNAIEQQKLIIIISAKYLTHAHVKIVSQSISVIRAGRHVFTYIDRSYHLYTIEKYSSPCCFRFFSSFRWFAELFIWLVFNSAFVFTHTNSTNVFFFYIFLFYHEFLFARMHVCTSS